MPYCTTGAGSGILASYGLSVALLWPFVSPQFNLLESYLVPQSFSRLSNGIVTRHAYTFPQANSRDESGTSKEYLAFTQGFQQPLCKIQTTTFNYAWSVIYVPK